MSGGIELPSTTFGEEPEDGLMSLKPGAKHEAKFRKYVLPQKHIAMQRLKLRNKACVRVSGLPFGMQQTNLKNFFKQFGTLLQVSVMKNAKNGKYNTFGYVYFEDAKVAEVAAKAMDHYLVCNSILRCKVLIGRQVKAKYFGQSDDSVHRKLNKAILKINNTRGTEKEAKLLHRRQKVADRALLKLGDTIKPQDLGITQVKKKRQVKSKPTMMATTPPKVAKKATKKSRSPALVVKMAKKSKAIKKAKKVETTTKVLTEVKGKNSKKLVSELITIAEPVKKLNKSTVVSKKSTVSPNKAKKTTESLVTKKTPKDSVKEKTTKSLITKKTIKDSVKEKTTKSLVTDKKTAKDSVTEKTTKSLVTDKKTAKDSVTEKTTKSLVTVKKTAKDSVTEKTTKSLTTKSLTTKSLVTDKKTAKDSVKTKKTTATTSPSQTKPIIQKPKPVVETEKVAAKSILNKKSKAGKLASKTKTRRLSVSFAEEVAVSTFSPKTRNAKKNKRKGGRV